MKKPYGSWMHAIKRQNQAMEGSRWLRQHTSKGGNEMGVVKGVNHVGNSQTEITTQLDRFHAKGKGVNGVIQSQSQAVEGGSLNVGGISKGDGLEKEFSPTMLTKLPYEGEFMEKERSAIRETKRRRVETGDVDMIFFQSKNRACEISLWS